MTQYDDSYFVDNQQFWQPEEKYYVAEITKPPGEPAVELPSDVSGIKVEEGKGEVSRLIN